MSDHYPSIKADKEMINKIQSTMKVTDEKKQIKNEKQHERIVKVNRIIKKYNQQENPRHSFRKQVKPEKEEEQLDNFKLTAKDIVLNPFVYSPDYKDHFLE